MKCTYCQGEMKKGTVPFHIDREGAHVGFDEITAWVCSQCGDSCFEDNEVDAMQELIKAIA
jgi:YgiT-type zinc finger domain-containing protein